MESMAITFHIVTNCLRKKGRRIPSSWLLSLAISYTVSQPYIQGLPWPKYRVFHYLSHELCCPARPCGLPQGRKNKTLLRDSSGKVISPWLILLLHFFPHIKVSCTNLFYLPRHSQTDLTWWAFTAFLSTVAGRSLQGKAFPEVWQLLWLMAI